MVKKNSKLFRIGEVESLTGFSRRTVHYYLQMGLLHPPKKTGKTMSYYDELHIRKLKQIGKLKQQGLSLFAIRKQMSAPTESDLLGKQPLLPSLERPLFEC